MKTMVLPYLDMGNCFLTAVKVNNIIAELISCSQ